jgi:cytochrome c peroxidase
MRLAALALALLGVVAAGGRMLPDPLIVADAAGEARTVSTAGAIDTAGPFFQPLGRNGRSCSTCHVAADGWSLTPATARALFEATDGTHPLFRREDAASAPTALDATLAQRRAAYGLLLARGLIRVGLPVPAGADFVVEAVDDPYGFASARELSLFRRPPPATNLGFASTLMWDGRETRDGRSRHADLAAQAGGAAASHLGVAALTDEQRRAIVAFESSLVTAQSRDDAAGDLAAAGARGGPQALAEQTFFPGINSSRAPGGFDRRAFSLFADWARADDAGTEARRAIARGEAIFNQRAFGRGNLVRGTGTCSSCHNTPNVGSNSLGMMFDMGLAAAARRPPDLPLYTLRCVRGGRAMPAGTTVQTTDPGQALVTGRCDDIGRFKVPTLRALAARAPYFHNGSAATLEAVVEFYDTRFSLGLTPRERADLLAFLRAL